MDEYGNEIEQSVDNTPDYGNDVYVEQEQPEIPAHVLQLAQGMANDPQFLRHAAGYYTGNSMAQQPPAPVVTPQEPQITDEQLSELMITDTNAYHQAVEARALSRIRQEMLPQMHASSVLPRFEQSVAQAANEYANDGLTQQQTNELAQYGQGLLREIAQANPVAVAANDPRVGQTIRQAMNARAYELSRQNGGRNSQQQYNQPQQPTRQPQQRSNAPMSAPVTGQRPGVSVPQHIAQAAQASGIPREQWGTFAQHYNNVQNEQRSQR